MKKLLSIMLLLATMLTFAACEDKNEPEKNPFVGKWECILDYSAGAEGQYKHKDIYELTIKKDYSAECMIKQYTNGRLVYVNTILYNWTIDDTTGKKTIYLFYSTENEGYNPIYNYINMRGVISGKELIVAEFAESVDGSYVGQHRYFEYTKK